MTERYPEYELEEFAIPMPDVLFDLSLSEIDWGGSCFPPLEIGTPAAQSLPDEELPPADGTEEAAGVGRDPQHGWWQRTFGNRSNQPDV